MPLQDDVQVVSVGDHVIEPPGVFQDRLPVKFKARGPRIELTDQGHDIWVYDGVPHPSIGLNAVAGKDRRDYGLDPTSYEGMRPGCYRVDRRVVRRHARPPDTDGTRPLLGH